MSLTPKSKNFLTGASMSLKQTLSVGRLVVSNPSVRRCPGRTLKQKVRPSKQLFFKWPRKKGNGTTYLLKQTCPLQESCGFAWVSPP